MYTVYCIYIYDATGGAAAPVQDNPKTIYTLTANSMNFIPKGATVSFILFSLPSLVHLSIHVYVTTTISGSNTFRSSTQGCYENRASKPVLTVNRTLLAVCTSPIKASNCIQQTLLWEIQRIWRVLRCRSEIDVCPVFPQ